MASLHTKYVVNLDFDSMAAESSGVADLQDENVKVLTFAGGQRKFRCRLPGGSNQTHEAAALAGEKDPRVHFLNAKMSSFRGTCRSLKTDYWTYDLCFGRIVEQHRAAAKLRFSLGEFYPDSDKLLPSGEVREIYLHGTENRTTEVHYVCGSHQYDSEPFSITEEQKHYYKIVVQGPVFCPWRGNDGQSTSTGDGKQILISALLEPLRGRCVNTTQGWWTYEYCFPTGMRQFHLEGVKREPEYVLGNALEPLDVNQVNLSMVRLKPSISPRERRAPPSSHMTLKQELKHGGAVCDETGRSRQTVVHFQCPGNWQSRPETQLVSVKESALCEYEVVIHTTLLCGHYKLLPTLPKGKESIQCVIDSDSNLGVER